MKLKCLMALTVGTLALLLLGCSDSQKDDMPSVGSRGSEPLGGQMPPGAGNMDPEQAARNELIAEYQQLQERLGHVQQQAMADSTLQQAFTALETRIEEAMVDVDADYPQKRERMSALQQEMTAAQQADDPTAMQRIGEEGNALQMQLEKLQMQVIERDDIAADIAEFRSSVEAKMTEIEPETPRLMARAAEIVATLQASTDMQEEGTPGG